MRILGISAYYHDSAAALVVNGQLVAAAEEERFSRKKHDAAFPKASINYCLEHLDEGINSVDYVVFYDKPILKFDRLLETYLSTAPRGFFSFCKSMPIWLKEKLYQKQQIKKALVALSGVSENALPDLLFTEHHQAHAAAAFYPSPFEEAAVLCLDGVGEWQTTSAWLGKGKDLTPLWHLDFPHSLGLLYSTFTWYLGFKVNSGEYKVMGLAPYGKPVYAEKIQQVLVDVKSDGTFHLNMAYFNFLHGLEMGSKKFCKLFDIPRRHPEGSLEQVHFDIAASIQKVIEDIIVALASNLRKESACKNLVLAGGVALNCVANGVLRRAGIYDDIWIQPAAGDSGAAAGAAFSVWHQYKQMDRVVAQPDGMRFGLLGPDWGIQSITKQIQESGLVAEALEIEELTTRTAQYLADGKVVGWFQGRMEFGPRALGNRSILADPRPDNMQSIVNRKIKNRESFRPFAPIVMQEHIANWFDTKDTNPYMLFVDQVRTDRRTIPAVTHVDGSARVQSISPDQNPRLHLLLTAFYAITDCPVLVNTSFNVRGEPIVCSPQDAIACFASTGMDVLVLGDYWIDVSKQTNDILDELKIEVSPDD